MRRGNRWLLMAILLAGCGLDDSAQVDCRCAADTDVAAFPECRGVDPDTDHAEAENPFSTRLPDCPSGDLLFLREPTTPEAVLFNVRDTFEGFSAVQYVDQLSETFLFVPELSGLELYREVYNPPGGYDPDNPADSDTLWARDEERRFATNLMDRERFQQVTVSRWYDAGEDERQLYTDEPERETYIFDYILDFFEQPGEDGTTRAFEVRGRMEVDLVTPSEENPVWSIRRMQDFRAGVDDQSLTELRGAFAQ
ncbi:MAG TPA: hypothetical protein QGF95_12670 [Candidatus Latescibacteria bacterium]|jgi:hypothetical protein|nr:hypothetical protein [Gemmatimonadaceae bacterium]MDP6014466.1 hypothetical protein [Candidatus Latescibacterota bacterium]HJP31396.1 hypothetical protein [Candidatus Latescibacterota bacterium]